ncbi:MAG TPA: BamA/TamA family outer membrane protein, partial [Gemmatimonas sp.]|nr:BamA/TamA family outer membrane protein [Gemmatimonas sp.]
MVDQTNLGNDQQRRAAGWSLTLPHVLVCNARRAVVAAGVVLLGAVTATSAIAQDKASPPVVNHPVIRSLEIDGNANVGDDELLAAMQTVPSHCKGFPSYCRILPFGWLRARERLDRDELDRDMLRLRVLYWKRGWRSVQVVPTIRPGKNDEVEVTIKVNEGPATVVGTMDIGVLDTLLSGNDRRRLVTLKPGDPLDLIRLDTIALKVAARLDARGYGDVLLNPVAVADTNSPRAAVKLEVQNLYKTKVEVVRVEGTERYDPRLVANTMGVDPGDEYSRTRLAESQRALYAAGFFRRAFVRVEPGSADSLKKLIAAVEELPPRSFRVTGGVSTVDFFQFDARYLNANFRNNASRLSLQATIGNLLGPQLVGKGPFNNVLRDQVSDDAPKYLQPTFQVNADLRRRWLSDYRNQSGLSLFGFRRSSPGVFVEQGGGGAASFTRNVVPYLPVTLQYRLEFTNTSAADTYFCVNFGVCDQASLGVLTKTQRLAPIALSTTTDRRDDPIGPTRGYSFRSELEFADSWTGSQLGYARFEIEGAKYFHSTEKLTVAMHARGGIVKGFGGSGNARGLGDRPIILPRKRFYAGGARSVRGYGENQLGPRVLVIPRSVFQPTQAGFDSLLADPGLRDGRLPCDPSIPLPQCPTELTNAGPQPRPTSNFEDTDFLPKPLGAETLLEASVEARYRFWGPLTGAVFVDAGSVGADFVGRATVFTPGVGIRYLSPVGPIRVDVGYNPRSREQLSVITELQPRDASWGSTRTEGLIEIPVKR